jgi:hypothetical protein
MESDDNGWHRVRLYEGDPAMEGDVGWVPGNYFVDYSKEESNQNAEPASNNEILAVPEFDDGDPVTNGNIFIFSGIGNFIFTKPLMNGSM